MQDNHKKLLTSIIVFTAIIIAFPAFGLGKKQELNQGLHAGVHIYKYQWDKEQSVFYVAEIDRNRADWHFKVAVARDAVLRKETVRSIASRHSQRGQRVLVAVNGGFGVLGSKLAGILHNLFIQNGELITSPISEPGWVCFGVTQNGEFLIGDVQMKAILRWSSQEAPILGINVRRGTHKFGSCQSVLYTPRFGESTRTPRAGYEFYLKVPSLPLTSEYKNRFTLTEARKGGNSQIKPDELILSVGRRYKSELFSLLKKGEEGEIEISLEPKEWNHAVEGIGGNVRLVADGKVDPAIMEYHLKEKRHTPGWRGVPKTLSHEPRTALGYNDEKLFLIVVDGRQRGYSEGMSMYEVAEVMIELGAKQVINLDGGSSSTFVVDGKVLNSPSGKEERAVLNAVLITVDE